MIGSIKIKIEGLNSGKIINALIDNGIVIKNLKEKYKYVIFELDVRDEKKFDSICRKYHKRYEVVSKSNLINLLKRTKNYFGFLFALILVVVFVFSFNLYIYEVKLMVSSDNDFDLTNIERLLKENGIVAGMRKDELEKSKLQQLIISSQDNVSGCMVKNDGGKLEIVIYPGVLKEDVSKENVYSKFEAIISKVNIFAGKSSLKEGDFVRVDDLLIENDNGAKGEIFGKVYFSDYLIFNENQVIKEFTGNQKEITEISIFGKYLFKNKNFTDFTNYIEEKCVFSASKNTFLPICLEKKIYKEFIYKETKVEFSTVKEELKKELYSNVLDKIELKYRDNISNITYSVVREDNLIRIDCFVECEINLVEWQYFKK